MALMLVQGSDEATYASAPEREEVLGESHIRARRNDDWLRAYESGVVGPDGVRRRQSMPMIAALYGVQKSTVMRGIDQARKLREAISDVGRLILPRSAG